MSQLLISLIAFLLAVSVVVAVHEYGHFWMARRYGIKVLRFSIGFGKSLFRWYDKLGTEYVISAIPLGGYVSLLGERGTDILPTEKPMSFSHQPVSIRMQVLAAGPLFNILFSILAYWLVFLMGVTQFVPILGNVPKDSVAALAGLKKGYEIVAIEGKETPSWEKVATELLGNLGEDKTIGISVRKNEKSPVEIKNLDLEHFSDGVHQDLLEGLGIKIQDPAPSIISTILPNSPAEKAGMFPKDRIIKVAGEETTARSEVINLIKANPGKAIYIEVLRGAKTVKLQLEPEVKEEEGKKIGFIGIEFAAIKEWPNQVARIQYYGPIEALQTSFKQTWHYLVLTFEMFKKMLLGKVSLKHISGPVAIATYAGQSINIGFQQFLSFLAMISISIGALNILPIPILDGGHILFCCIELIKGRPVSEATYNIGVWVGAFILLSVMALAFYNDFSLILR
jgi:regulator of sigma E protease